MKRFLSRAFLISFAFCGAQARAVEFVGHRGASHDAPKNTLASFRPSIVLYDAGVDPHASDGLGRLALSDAGLWRREMMVLHTCLAAGVPVAGYVGGGYDADLEVLAARHCLLHKAAAQAWVEHGL